jgi:hypothetical protein
MAINRLTEMLYYARVVFEKAVSAAEGHDDLATARRWIDEERLAKPELFRNGQILEATPQRQLIAACDAGGWHEL